MVGKKWAQKLLKEMAVWVDEALITPVQADRIKGRYTKELAYNQLMSWVFTLGSILVGLGMILFIGSNWEHLGRPFKVGLVFAFILGFNLTGYFFRFGQKTYPKLGESLLFLGAVSFGAGIWLVAQIFQIPYNYSNGLLFWMMGIFPTVFLLRSRSILVLSSLLLSVWCGSVIFDSPGTLHYLFFSVLAVIVSLSYREKQKISFFFALLASCLWLSHYLFVKLGRDIFGIVAYSMSANLFIAYGFLLYVLGLFHAGHERFGSFSVIYKFLGTFLILLGDYSLTFSHHYFDPGKGMFPIFSVSGVSYLLFFLAAVGFSKFASGASPSEEGRREAKMVLLFLRFQIVAIPTGQLGTTVLSTSYNLLLFAELILFLYVGYLLREELIFRTSLYFFALDTLTRYFDTFWRLLPRSLFFTLGGLILIFGGVFMERQRKAIEKKMQAKEETIHE